MGLGYYVKVKNFYPINVLKIALKPIRIILSHYGIVVHYNINIFQLIYLMPKLINQLINIGPNIIDSSIYPFPQVHWVYL